MNGLWQDLVLGLRSMLRQRGFTLVIVATLAIGIGANTAMFSILNAAMLRPLPFPEPERLVLGYSTFDGGSGDGYAMLSAPDYFDCRDQSDVFESVGAMLAYETSATVIAAGEPERLSSTFASVELFETLGVSPMLGRGFTPDEARPGAPPVAIVSAAFWRDRLGGDASAIGSSLEIDGNPYTVVGVMPPGFRVRADYDVWRPMVDDPGSHLPRRMHNWHMVGRLKPGVTLEQARGHVAVIAQRLREQYPDSNRNKGLGLTPLHEALVHGDRASLLALMGAVALVLLIACANVAGLLLARGCTRAPELAMRAALGGSRLRLARQLLIESAVLALVAGAGALVLAAWLQTLLLRVIPLDTLGVREVSLDSNVLLFALGLSAATALLSGLVPAWRSAHTRLAAELHAGARTTETRGSTRVRAILITSQVALSVMLLVASGLLIRSLARLHAVELGFRHEKLITAEIQLPGSRYRDTAQRLGFANRLLERTRALPGVEGAGLINLLPVREPRNNVRVWAADAPPSEDRPSGVAFIRSVLPGYFETMGIPRQAGRDIRASDTEGSAEVIVINQRMAENLFPDREPVGRQVVIDYPGAPEPASARVVGVVGDVRIAGPAFPAPAVLYASLAQRRIDAEMQLAVRTSGDPEASIGSLRAVVRELDPQVPLSDVATMAHFLGRRLTDHETTAALLSTFALVAVLLVALGLYGMLSFYVGQRTKEIGVRMALGATSRDLVRIVVQRGMTLVAIGLVIGLVGAWAASRLLAHLLHDVPAGDPLAFGAASLLFSAVALGACLLPARRATRIDPAVSLTAE